MPDTPHIVHASCVSIAGRAALIVGPSGSGKSGLALQLLALGAQLVADDRAGLSRDGDDIIAQCPPTIAGQIEARHVGIFSVADPSRLTDRAKVALVIDMGREERQRLPEPHSYDVLGVTMPCLWRVGQPHFASTILLYLDQTIALRP